MSSKITFANLLLLVLLSLSVMLLRGGSAIGAKSGKAIITYVSSEGLYIDAGTKAGLSVGDSLLVYRGKNIVGSIVISSISSRSSAATPVSSKVKFKAGDIVKFTRILKSNPDQKSKQTTKNVNYRNKNEKDRPNRLSGQISFGNYYHKDQTGSRLGWYQPSVRSRLVVTNIGGTGLTLKLRQRLRLYHRAKTLYSGQAKNKWSHQLYEISLVSGDRYSPEKSVWGVGRVLAPDVRGMGFIDGGYYSHRINEKLRTGVAIGTVPSVQTSDIQLERRKIGFFATYTLKNKDIWKADISAALSGEYERDTLSREFLYVQTSFSMGKWLYWFQSAEIDYNRSWRFSIRKKRFDLTNYYTNASFQISKALSMDFSYDNRRNIRLYESKNTPDSLFDDRTHQGLKAGFRVHFLNRITLRGNGSIRFREGVVENNRLLSFIARVNRFPLKRYTTTIQMAIMKTEFSSGYRPTLVLRFPVMHRLILNVTGAGYFYKTGTNTTSNYYLDINSSYTFGGRYYLYGGIRQYLDKQLQSFDMFAELGIDF